MNTKARIDETRGRASRGPRPAGGITTGATAVCSLLALVAAAGLSALAFGCAATPDTTRREAVVTPIDSVPPDARLSELAGELRHRVAAGEFQSLAVGVIEQGEVIWAEAWGLADRETGERATTRTPYGIASLGKSVTATALMTLVQGGFLDLDTEVNEVLGEGAVAVSVGRRSPTVRELLNMTSGVPHGALTYRTDDHPDEAAVMSHRSFVALPPGASFHYSNFSMALVDAVIEKVSGRSFPYYLEQEVFIPLGMYDSAVGLDVLPRPAARYFEDGEPVGPIRPFPRSSRQMSASLSDLLQFAAFHLTTLRAGQRPILSAASIEAMQNERSGLPGAHMALGIANLALEGGGSWVISSGNDMGVQSNLSIVPEAGVGVVVLTNSSGYQADELAIRAVDAVVPGFLARAIPAIGAFEGRTTAFVGEPDWVGTWTGQAKCGDGDLGVTMRFTPDGTVSIRLDGQGENVVQEAALRDGQFTGAFTGRLPLEERLDEDHRIELGLQLFEGDVVGFILANFANERGKFEIPTFLRLERDAE